MEEKEVSEGQKQHIEKELIEAWEQTGLLTNAINKISLAKVLEASSRTVLDLKTSLPEDQVAYVATMIFPIITRALSNINFDAKYSENTKTEITFVKLVETEEEQIHECIRAATELYHKLSQYNPLTVSFVKLSKFDAGFHIGLDCAST